MGFLDSIARAFIYVPSPPGQTLDELFEAPKGRKGLPDFEEVNLKTSDGESLHAWFAEYPGAQQALLYCHGNAGHIGSRTETIQSLRERLQCHVMIFDYRGYGRSTGHPREQGLYTDTEKALWFLRERSGLGPEQIFLFGRSLGAAVAMETKIRHPELGGLILISPFASIVAMAGQLYGLSWLAGKLGHERFDNVAKAPLLKAPLLVIHGSADALIPMAQGRAVFDHAVCEKQWRVVEGADHYDVFLLGGEELLSEIADWLRQRLNK